MYLQMLSCNCLLSQSITVLFLFTGKKNIIFGEILTVNSGVFILEYNQLLAS